MHKLKIQLQENYKSFKSDFECELNGDLILLSGVNGSGKSQLLDIITQKENGDTSKIISATVELDGQKITHHDILYRSFKNNVDIRECTIAGFESIKKYAEQIYNHYIRCKLNCEDPNLLNYQSSAKQAKRLLISMFGEENFQNKTIAQLAIERVLPIDFIWKVDDIFENQIGEAFFNYACDVKDAKEKAGEDGEKFDYGKLPISPWKELNKLFEDLNFDYRFKDNYFIKKFKINEQPSLYELKSDKTIDYRAKRKLSDLSHGEKAIISLSFASLLGIKKEDKKILVLDEYDATLNPSLTEVFFKVIKKYFIDNGILVILATHSPVTITLSPEGASYYEMFKQNIAPSRIIHVNKSQFTELQGVYKNFYNKISDQPSRVKELEEENKKLKECIKQVEKSNKPSLIVEDTYDYIYKIAWLKLNDIVYQNTEEDIDEKFKAANFEIFGYNGAGSVAGFLRAQNVDINKDKKIVGLLDFDEEGSRQFYFLHNDSFWGKEILGEVTTGLYKKRSDHLCFYALLLPVPDRLKDCISDIRSEDFWSVVEIENLLPENFLRVNNLCKEKKRLGLKYLKPKEDKKPKLWKCLYELDKNSFKDFKPLFDKIEEFFN